MEVSSFGTIVRKLGMDKSMSNSDRYNYILDQIESRKRDIGYLEAMMETYKGNDNV
jgi:hypothetical protein